MPESYTITLNEARPSQFLFGNFTDSDYDTPNNQIEPFQNISSLERKEMVLFGDLLNILDSKEGIYIKYNHKMDLNDTFTCLSGLDYEVDPQLDQYYKEIITQVVSLSKMISSIDHFQRYFNKSYYGNVMSRLCQYIRNFLNSHRLFLGQLRNSNPSVILLSQRLNNQPFEKNYGTPSQCIQHLYDFTQQIITDNYKRLQKSSRSDMKFESIMNSLKEDVDGKLINDVIIDSSNSKYIKGGIVLNMLQSEIVRYRGNEKSSHFLKDLYQFISTGYLKILNDWLQYGKFADQFDEFFITEEKVHVDVYNTYYWINKFAIKRESLISQFKEAELQKKIFLTGKYLAILNECHCSKQIEEKQYEFIESFNDITLEEFIDKAYKRSNDLITETFLKRYSFSMFIKQMNTSFLMTDASNIDTFLNLANHDLRRSYGDNVKVDLIRYYNRSCYGEKHHISETFVSELINVKFENQAILNDVLEIIRTHATDSNKILTASNLGTLKELLQANVQMNTSFEGTSESDLKRCNKLTISHFSIDLDVPFPLNQVIIDSQKLEYQLIFRHNLFLKFLLKRMEKSWREIGYHSFWTWGFEDKKITKWIRRCRYVHTKMFDFLKIYSFYLNHDVLENNWNEVESTLSNFLQNNIHFNLIDLKFQLTEFLGSSLCDMLLSHVNITTCLYELFTLILMFHEYVLSLRKNLLLIDEGLLDMHRERLNLSFVYNSTNKESRFNEMSKILESYDMMFESKITKFCEYLGYFGEIDAPRMLVLHSKLVSSFKF